MHCQSYEIKVDLWEVGEEGSAVVVLVTVSVAEEVDS
jgi:hypothetical protein